MTLYVVPDIHGHKVKLDQSLDLIRCDGGLDAPVIFLGDYVDRGPDSCGVIQTLLDGAAGGRNWIFLRGNHDQMFLDFLELAPSLPQNQWPEIHWLSYRSGYAEALASYGVHVQDKPDAILSRIPESHCDFLAATKFTYETDDLFFVHAGIMPGVGLSEQTPEDCMWMREPFLSDTRDHGKLIVHGHVPLEAPQHFGNRVDLDSGAGWGRALCPAVFEGRDCWLLTGEGRVPLRP